MTITRTIATMAAAAGLLLVSGAPMAADQSMGFFVTSVAIGNGADLGGLEGADAHCAKLGEAAGSKGRTWRAYLSTQSPDGKARGKSARDRIGKGPWYNARGELIASDLDQLHLSPNIIKRTALDENGNLVKGRGDKPNQHDILTGSKNDGTAYFPWEEGDHTCSNWTSSADGQGSAQVGHHDRHGGGNTSWNSAHPSRGCSQQNLMSTGGNGFLYCFAAD
ncbi:MAG: hypothetical protein OET44_18620 [Gammaproteobacteria bacterium]|nr:hypothetical protein [Gammaproteobacteria bacterium]